MSSPDASEFAAGADMPVRTDSTSSADIAPPAWDVLGSAEPVTTAPELSVDALRIDSTAGSGPAEDAENAKVLAAYEQALVDRSERMLGYPYNLSYEHAELFPFLRFSINNLGDPFVTSNYGVHSRKFELSVLRFFADLWRIEEGKYWGYCTTCGTEGNLHGILLAREVHPEGILYASRESHYSVFKAARFYRMDAVSVPTLYTGEIDYEHLRASLIANRDKPAIINVNVGTTVKGAVDDLDRILRIFASLDWPREKYYIHCDGALFALMLPFVKHAPEISFRKPIDSIAVSGHKGLGCPMPSGIVITRKQHVERVERTVEYLNSKDTTIMGSRNGQAPLFLWYSLRKKGVAGLRADTEHCLRMARLLADLLLEAGVSTMLNDLSTTVVLERPRDDEFERLWHLACEGEIAHVVVMPQMTEEKARRFVDALVEARARPSFESRCVKKHIGPFCRCKECGNHAPGTAVATSIAGSKTAEEEAKVME